MSGRNFASRDNPQRFLTQGQHGTSVRDDRGPRGRGGNSYQAPNGAPRWVNQGPAQLGEEEQLVEDLMGQLEESNAKNELLRAELQRKSNAVERRAPENAFKKIQIQLRKQIQLNETLQDDLKNTEGKLDEATRSCSELQLQIRWQQDTMSGLQTQLENVKKENEAQGDGGTGQENDLPTLQSKLKQQINKNASLENYIKNLQATIEDREELCRDKDRRMNETRLELRKKCDQLQTEKEDKAKLRNDVALMEEQLYKVQIQKDQIEKELVQRLQKTPTEHQQTMTNLQKQKLIFKTEMQAEFVRNEDLEERLKLLNWTFEKREFEMEVALRKTQDQLKKVEGEYEAYVTQMGKRLTDANTIIEKEKDCLQKERQANVELKEHIRRRASRRATEAESYNDKVRDSEVALKQEVEIRKQLQAKVSALEKALEEQKGAVRDLKTVLKSERVKFKEAASKYSARFKTVVMERNELSRTVADQRQTMESDKKQMNELSQALATEQVTTRGLQQEKEVLLLHMEKKRKSKWKFWQRI